MAEAKRMGSVLAFDTRQSTTHSTAINGVSWNDGVTPSVTFGYDKAPKAFAS
jgi:hypothetical protein